MTDYFALLGLARRPWLEEEAIKNKFLELARQTHPDYVLGGSGERQPAASRSAEINAAYSCLREPNTRLRHLLELENGARPKDLQNVPAEMTDFFLTVSGLNREVDAFQKEKGATISPLLKLQLFEKSQDYVGRLQVLLKTVESRTAELVNQLKGIDKAWSAPNLSPEERAGLLQQLESLYRLFGFHARWAGSLRERVGRLSFDS